MQMKEIEAEKKTTFQWEHIEMSAYSNPAPPNNQA